MAITHSLDTKVAPEKIWRIWSDPSQWPQWNPSVKAMEMRGPFAVGTQAVMTTDRGAHTVTFTQIDEGRSFVLESPIMPGVTAAFTCNIQQVGSGSRISQTVSMRGPLAGVMFPLMGKMMASTIPSILQGLANRAELG